ncbi:hypothetical protein GCM10023172_17510 [Hymenobacter ginsengisoli]|uniref:histidine kinase n=1 Tax=Hymenobacter ginsengisoli TaxID=1051626 RepID=A0ABP8QB89_9BACT|nr:MULTISPECIES: ATP-binding protein [unclassified Hymenobacter]MBO2030706.1 PAS domain-containing protein [Hymenobacter sp. BT559]
MPAFTPTPAASLPAHFLPALLETSLSGVLYLTPRPDAAGEVVDFELTYLNPAAQRLLALPTPPGGQLRQQLPQLAAGLLAFYRGEGPGEFGWAAPAGHSPGPGRLAARRVGEGLLVSLSGPPKPDELPAGRLGEQHPPAYAEVIRQRAQLYHLLEQALAIICILDGPEHVFEFVNPPCQALVGGRPLLGRPIAEALPELAGQPYFDLLNHVYRTGEAYSATERLGQLDGRAGLEKRYYNFICQARRNARGEVDGVFVFAYDVSAQVATRQLVEQQNAELERRVHDRTQAAEQAQRTAEEQRQQLKQLFMQAPAAICVLGGAELIFELVNPLCQRAFPGRELLGRPLLEALPELRATPLASTLARVYATGEAFLGQEVPLRLAGTERDPSEPTYWALTFQARRNGDGRIDGLLVFAYEVTAQVRARQAQQAVQEHTQALADELQRTNEQLRKANADLDNFVHMASHDLKAPITNIEGLLHSLHQELRLPAAEADTAIVLRLMQDSVRRFQRTIHYLADMSKWQQAATEPARAVPLAELVASVRLDMAPLLQLSGGHIELAPDSCATITFPEKQLRSIVFNLLSNALKYRSPERPPHVRVRCTNDTGTEVVLEVSDNGLGLNPAQQAQIFGMFQRQHDHVEGSGVGLYLVKKVIDSAGGRVEVSSQPGVGSVFRIVLPQ